MASCANAIEYGAKACKIIGQLVCLKATSRATGKLLQPFIHAVQGDKKLDFEGLAELKADVVDQTAFANEDGAKNRDMLCICGGGL